LIAVAERHPTPDAVGHDAPAVPLALRATSLRKRFGEIEAVRNVSLSVRRTEIYGLLGPNGAGKSTTINILSGLIEPDEGTAQIAGHVLGSIEAKRVMGIVPQELAIYPELNARENLSFFGQLYGLSGGELKARIDRTLELVNLENRARDAVGTYSGGMQRRLNIAAGILHEPKLVLMDEPTVGLDPQSRRSILDLVQSLALTGTAIVYSTHYMDEVEQICDRVGIIDRGALLVEGTVDELRQSLGGRELVTLRGLFQPTMVQLAFDGMHDVALVRATDDEVLLNVAGAAARLQALLGTASRLGEIREVLVSRPTLEMLFLKLTGRELRE
jgi:ABC-2 type transport system ATP-binding protein